MRTNEHVNRAPQGRIRSVALAFAGAIAAALAIVPAASADSLGPITFAAPGYATGDINGQKLWSNTGAFDAKVVATDARAQSLGFGLRALQMSNATVSGSFANMPIAPKLADLAGEARPISHFEASFKIAASQNAQVPVGAGPLAISVSPDSGDGGRMSYLRFADLADGIHVIFVDVTDPGPLPTVASFDETDIATLSRTAAHTVRLSVDFKPGPANDVVQVFIDGVLVTTGGSWEDYYRYDAEQTGGGNVVPNVRTLLFRLGGGTIPANLNALTHGFLISDVVISTSAPEGPTGPTGEAGATGASGANGSNGSSGSNGTNGATGADGKSASGASTVALKRKMSITFPQATVTTNGANAKVQVRCNGSTLQRCIGTLTLKSQGTVQRAAYAVLKGQTATVTVPLDSDLVEKLSAGGAGTVARAVARTEQDAGRPFRTSRKLHIG
jgi:hypothetical protein